MKFGYCIVRIFCLCPGSDAALPGKELESIACVPGVIVQFTRCNKVMRRTDSPLQSPLAQASVPVCSSPCVKSRFILHPLCLVGCDIFLLRSTQIHSVVYKHSFSRTHVRARRQILTSLTLLGTNPQRRRSFPRLSMF